MRKLLALTVLPLAATVGLATPAAAAPAPATMTMPSSSSPLCFGVGQIGFCVPFT